MKNKKKEIRYLKRKNKWIKKNNIKVGDIVIVKRKSKDRDYCCESYWVGSMDKFVGKECKIISIEEFSIYLSDPWDKVRGFYFPFSVLKKVKTK